MSWGAICTWKDCRLYATKPQISKTKETWANLCDEHDKALDNAIATLDPAIMIQAWILAQGGSKALAEKM